jgi:acyl-CoA reductase-like NAD-dependent aldehyde dehydrogenase
VTSTTAGAARLGHADELFIGGEWVAPSTTSRFDVVNPASEEIVYSVAEATTEDVSRATAAARAAFDSGPWPRLTHRERAAYLSKMADLLDARSDDLCRCWTEQTGLTYAKSQAIIPVMTGTFRYYAELADTYPFVERHDQSTAANVGILLREPVGVVGAIVAWNGPALLIASKAVPALLAGCTVVIKASPEGPGEAYLFAEAAAAAGLPPGVVNVVVADREASESLVRDERIDKISFTGSTAAGQRVAALCGQRIARVSLELGGKSPALVLDDYDLGAAAAALATATTFLAGQVCSAVTRIIVTEHRHDDLVDALSSEFAKTVVGDPYDPNTDMGPLATRRQRDRVAELIAAAVNEGSRLAHGGRRPDLAHGFYLEPTVFAAVDNDSTIAREEVFGPVLSVIAARDDEHAIALANNSPYGLSAAVFTNDVERAYQVARELRCGMVAHNAVRNELGIAFGGFKRSGLGRKGGLEGLLPFLEVKTVTLDGVPERL